MALGGKPCFKIKCHNDNLNATTTQGIIFRSANATVRGVPSQEWGGKAQNLYEVSPTA
jgi:hypothetical protein